MTAFEASAEPLQEWLNSAEVRVQESSARLHDLSAKKQELGKLQVIIERPPMSNRSRLMPDIVAGIVAVRVIGHFSIAR